MKKAMMLLATALLALAPFNASAAVRTRVFVGVGGPAFYAPGWYAPYWGNYWGPGPYYSFSNAGEVKIDTKVKTAEVFINGAYAGTTKDNHTMHLRQGSYDIEIRENNQTAFMQRVFVAPGKTIHIAPVL